MTSLNEEATEALRELETWARTFNQAISRAYEAGLRIELGVNGEEFLYLETMNPGGITRRLLSGHPGVHIRSFEVVRGND